MKINKLFLILMIVVIFVLGILVGLNLENSESGAGPINLNFLQKSCQYNGKTYKSGEGFKDVDGCNSCSCENGNVACTLMACEGDILSDEELSKPNTSSKSCVYNGKTYISGEGFKDVDGCNSCSCENGNVACTLMACEK